MPATKEATSGAPPAWQRLNVLHLLLLVPWVGIVVAAHRPIRDNSFLWHVRAGELQLQGGEVLRQDPFSFTFGGADWRTQSWLAELVYGRLESWFGLDFVPWLVIAAASLTLVLVGVASYRRTHRYVAVAAGLLVALWLGLSYFSPRPVLLSYVLLALLVVLLDLRARWALPLVIWLWAAIHGSFVLGLGLIALEGVRTRDRRRLGDLAAATLAASLTAHGLAIWSTLWDFFQNRGALELITEWAPPNVTRPGQFPYVLLLVGLLVAAARGRLSLRDLWVPVPFVLFGLTSARALFPALIVVLPWALLAWPEPSARRTRDPGRPRAIVHWVLAAGMVIVPLVVVSFAGLSHTRFPVAASEHLTSERIFHDDVTGGFLIWRGESVYVDDRAELYGEEFFEEFISVRNARPGWEAVLDEWGIQEVLARTSDGLVAALPAQGWSEAFRDDEFVLFVRP
ncbi:MAG: hypothetical protein ACE5MI_07600 [Acidimicrobiia bacterium]